MGKTLIISNMLLKINTLLWGGGPRNGGGDSVGTLKRRVGLSVFFAPSSRSVLFFPSIQRRFFAFGENFIFSSYKHLYLIKLRYNLLYVLSTFRIASVTFKHSVRCEHNCIQLNAFYNALNAFFNHYGGAIKCVL